MSSNQNNYYLRKEIQISTDQIPKEENLSQISSKNQIKNENIQEEIYQQENDNENNNEIILNNEKEEEINNNNHEYSKDIYIINRKEKFSNIKKNQQIYTKIKTESSRAPKAKISTYIYKSGKAFPKKNNITSNINKYIMNKAKYSIKNPIKEKSKNKYKKNKINETDINNINNNINIDDYENNNINQTNYIYERNNGIDEININNDIINDNENNNNINIITKTKNYKNKRMISQKQNKPDYISFNRFNKIQDIKFNYVPNTTKAEGRITYICDYSQENNKDSYYVESPNRYKRNITVYPIDAKVKKRKTKAKAKKYKSSDKLKKEVEDSKKKFEKIREIEREIKNYFNLNGLDILNRELYDQSATMIQATFRAYFSRKKLYDELNLYINIKNAIDILKDIFKPRKIIYWENFMSSLLEYITILNSNTNTNMNDNIIENEVNLNSEKYQDLNDEFNNIENNKIKYVKKIPNSYKQKSKNKILNENFIIPQPCISFYFDNKSNKEQSDKSNIKGRNTQKSNLSINDNIIKDTQESVELKLNDELKVFKPKNNEIKMDKLKYVLKLLELKYKEILYKCLIKLSNYSELLKYSSDLNNSNINKEKNKALKRIVMNKDKNLKNIKKNFFVKFYFKGLINFLIDKILDIFINKIK